MAFSRRRTNLSWKGKLGPETLEAKSIFKWLNKQGFFKKKLQILKNQSSMKVSKWLNANKIRWFLARKDSSRPKNGAPF